MKKVLQERLNREEVLLHRNPAGMVLLGQGSGVRALSLLTGREASHLGNTWRR